MPVTQDLGTGTLGHRNLGHDTLTSRTLRIKNRNSDTLRIELVTQIPGILRRATDPHHRLHKSHTIYCISFNCEAKFDNKKLGHVSRKLRGWSR